jgi:hypothetical protein
MIRSPVLFAELPESKQGKSDEPEIEGPIVSLFPRATSISKHGRCRLRQGVN